MKTEKRINYESPEAASIQTVTGWVSSNGCFWGKDEHTARYDGSTHRICKENPEHGEHRTNSYCEKCRDEKRNAKWAAMPRREYDGTPVVVFDSDTYFFDGDSIADWLADNDIKPEDARLVFCEPNYLRQLTDDGELSDAVRAALDALNAVIAAEPPSSWSEGNEAVVLPANFLEQQP
jgi:hypothetical protein